MASKKLVADRLRPGNDRPPASALAPSRTSDRSGQTARREVGGTADVARLPAQEPDPCKSCRMPVDVSSLVPVGTFIGGLIGAGVLDHRRDRRQERREERTWRREVLAADRRLASDFERETLLAVQAGVQSLGRVAAQNYLAAVHWDHSGKPPQDFRNDGELDVRQLEESAHLKQLTERVADSDVRVLLHRLRTQLVAATHYGIGAGRVEIDVAFDDARETRDELERAVGNRLRSLIFGLLPVLGPPAWTFAVAPDLRARWAGHGAPVGATRCLSTAS